LALEKLRSQDRSKRRVVILSDFVQVTRNSEKLYREVASQMEQAGVTLFIGIGEDLIKYSSLFGWTEARFYSTTEEFLKREKLSDFANMAILLKGARKFQFERIATNMQRHAHKTLLEVDLDAMARNLNHFRELVPADTKFAVMVKAFSYGCGGAEIASMLQYQGVDYLMVAYADEGVELREAGITARIAVMNPEPEAFDKLIENGLEPELFSVEMVKSFAKVVANRGKLLYPVHIKLNTGMNRSGFNEYELDELISVLKREETLKVSSIFSHLAVADESDQDAFTLLQIERFQNMCVKIEKQFDYKIIRHILNSAGIERFPEYHFDMVRLGIGLHGISAANKSLEPVAIFKTHIAAIRQVKSSETIGYGRKGVLARDSRIAVILVGYADGLDRHLSCGVGEMYVKGHRVPIVGNICMDACMLDVTDYPDIQVGDQVEIFGKNVPVTEISDKLGTIPYEVLTRISRRVKRVFVKE
jgi:alanine racemase